MLKLVRGLVGTLFSLLFLLGVAYAGWRWGDLLFPRVESSFGADRDAEVPDRQASPALAKETLERIQALQSAEEPEELSLDGAQVESLLRYADWEQWPEAVTDPEVDFRSSRVHLSGRIAVASSPRLSRMGGMLGGMLPDTLSVSAEGSLIPFGIGGAVLFVHGMSASGIPLPSRSIPEILAALGGERPQGLPPEAILLPLPEGIEAAYISSDRLILIPQSSS